MLVSHKTGMKRETKWLQGWEGTGATLYCWWECEIVQSLGKTPCWFLKELNIELP